MSHATEIAKSKGLNIVCRPDRFHTLMSFLGSIRTVIGGSVIPGVLGEHYSLFYQMD